MFRHFLSEHLSSTVDGFFGVQQLLDLPLEILIQVVSELDCGDYLALTLCCKNLFVQLSHKQIFCHFLNLYGKVEEQAIATLCATAQEANIHSKAWSTTIATVNAVQMPWISAMFKLTVTDSDGDDDDDDVEHPSSNSHFQQQQQLLFKCAMILKNMCHLGEFQACLSLLQKPSHSCMVHQKNSNGSPQHTPSSSSSSSEDTKFFSIMDLIDPFHQILVNIIEDVSLHVHHFARLDLAPYLDIMVPFQSLDGLRIIAGNVAKHCKSSFASVMRFLCEQYGMLNGPYIFEMAIKKGQPWHLKELVDHGFPVPARHKLMDLIAQQPRMDMFRAVLRLGLKDIQLFDIATSCLSYWSSLTDSDVTVAIKGSMAGIWAYLVDPEPDLGTKDAKYPSLPLLFKLHCHDIHHRAHRRREKGAHSQLDCTRVKLPFVPLGSFLPEAARALLNHILGATDTISSSPKCTLNLRMILKEEKGDTNNDSGNNGQDNKGGKDEMPERKERVGLYLQGVIQCWSGQASSHDIRLSSKLYELKKEQVVGAQKRQAILHHHGPLAQLLFHVISLCLVHRTDLIRAAKLVLALCGTQFPEIKSHPSIARAICNTNCGEILLWMHQNGWAIHAKGLSFDAGLNGCLNVLHALDLLSLLDIRAMLRGAAQNGRTDTLAYSVLSGLLQEVKDRPTLGTWWAAAVINSHCGFLKTIRGFLSNVEQADVTYCAASRQQYPILNKLVKVYHYKTDSRIVSHALFSHDYKLLKLAAKWHLPLPNVEQWLYDKPNLPETVDKDNDCPPKKKLKH